MVNIGHIFSKAKVNCFQRHSYSDIDNVGIEEHFGQKRDYFNFASVSTNEHLESWNLAYVMFSVHDKHLVEIWIKSIVKF